MKRLFSSLSVLAVSMIIGLGAHAQTKFGVANHLGVDVNAGTTGVGVELSTPITQWIQARAGLSVMPGINFNVGTTVSGTETVNGVSQDWESDLDVTGELKRVQGSLIFNVYPFGGKGSFFIAGGAYFGGQDLLKISGQLADYDKLHNLQDAGVEIGDYKLPLGPNGEVAGALRVAKFRPYVGFGTGRACPKHRLGFMWELGVQFQKKAFVWDDINKERVNISEFSSDDTFQKIIDKVQVYPVLRFTIAGRIF